MSPLLVTSCEVHLCIVPSRRRVPPSRPRQGAPQQQQPFAMVRLLAVTPGLMKTASSWSSPGATPVLSGLLAMAYGRPAPVRRPVPADLVGRCFNYLSYDHVAARCPNPSRCLRCEGVGHSAKNSKRARRGPAPARG
jgi:hypothetical protein